MHAMVLIVDLNQHPKYSPAIKRLETVPQNTSYQHNLLRNLQLNTLLQKPSSQDDVINSVCQHGFVRDARSQCPNLRASQTGRGYSPYQLHSEWVIKRRACFRCHRKSFIASISSSSLQPLCLPYVLTYGQSTAPTTATASQVPTTFALSPKAPDLSCTGKAIRSVANSTRVCSSVSACPIMRSLSPTTRSWSKFSGCCQLRRSNDDQVHLLPTASVDGLAARMIRRNRSTSEDTHVSAFTTTCRCLW
jgi:hypothetical protein